MYHIKYFYFESFYYHNDTEYELNLNDFWEVKGKMFVVELWSRIKWTFSSRKVMTAVSTLKPTCAPPAPQCDWPAVTPDSCFSSARCWGGAAAVCGREAGGCGRAWRRVSWRLGRLQGCSAAGRRRRSSPPNKAPLIWRWSGREWRWAARGWGGRWGRRHRCPVGARSCRSLTEASGRLLESKSRYHKLTGG